MFYLRQPAFRSLFQNSDDEEEFAGFDGDLADYDMEGAEEDECVHPQTRIFMFGSHINVQ